MITLLMYIDLDFPKFGRLPEVKEHPFFKPVSQDTGSKRGVLS